MAGTIEIRPGVRWSAASWLFDWVLSTVASEVSNAELADTLREIVDENLGFLALTEVTEDQRSQFRAAVAGLPDGASVDWRGVEGRDSALGLLDDLRENIG